MTRIVLLLALLAAVALSHKSGSHSHEGSNHHGHGHHNGHGHHHGHGHGHNEHNSHHHHGHGHHGHHHNQGHDGHHHPSHHGHKKHHVHYFQDNINLDHVSASDLKDSFKEWKKVFGKTYVSSAEEAGHYQTYLANWKSIIDFNKNQNETFKMGMNQFSDLTGHQFSQFIGSCFKGGATPRKLWNEKLDVVSPGVAANPASVDWTTKGVVTAVKNQGQCGSCWAFSTTGSLECRSAIKTGKLISLSEQQLVDCSRAEGNEGCNGGLMDDAFKYVKKEGGLCSETEYPYLGRDGICKASSCGTKYDPLTGYTDVPKDSAPDLETAAAAGCVSVAIEADQSAFQFYKKGILSGRCGTRLDHGVLVVGYGAEGNKKYWKVKNSWGKTWGEQGYVRVCKECGKDLGKGECGILEQPSYPLV